MHRSTIESARLTVSSAGRRRQRTNNLLTDPELNEVFERQLESVNPLRSTNVVHFDYKKKEFVTSGVPSPIINLLHFKSLAILKTSSEALESDDFDECSDLFVESRASFRSDDAAAEDMKVIFMPPSPHKKKIIVNAFNFCEEATQTIQPSYRNMESQSIPPAKKGFASSISAQIIFDAYARDFGKQPTTIDKKPDPGNGNDNFSDSVKLMERVVCLNVFGQVYLDFGYYEDPADEFRSEGRLLPLWSFSLPRRILPVTDIQWSHEFFDLFSATFGDINNIGEGGAIAVFSIKNCLCPDFMVETASPALCISLNSKFTSLLVVGFLDGNVSVYDTITPEAGPIFASDIDNKHRSYVNAIRWVEDETNFFSISSDGCVKYWQAMATMLAVQNTFHIEMPTPLSLGPEGIKLNIKCAGLRFAFHPNDRNVYLIGTAEGYIISCCIRRDREPSFVYYGHRLPVLRISYNLFVPNIFISCSADSTVKIWENCRSDPLLTFDLGAGVVDTKWSPYTSTVFAALCIDGLAHIYDLSINQYRPILIQKVVSTVKGNEPTQLTFNKKYPVVMVTDKRGHIFSLKLSPNLRILAKATKKDSSEPREREIRKFNAFLSIMKPQLLQQPIDCAAP